MEITGSHHIDTHSIRTWLQVSFVDADLFNSTEKAVLWICLLAKKWHSTLYVERVLELAFAKYWNQKLPLIVIAKGVDPLGGPPGSFNQSFDGVLVGVPSSKCLVDVVFWVLINRKHVVYNSILVEPFDQRDLVGPHQNSEYFLRSILATNESN